MVHPSESSAFTVEEELFDELIIDFVDSLPEWWQQISELAIQRDFESLNHQAHKLKGCAGSMGYDHLSKRSRLLELQSALENESGVDKLVGEIREAIESIDIAPIRERFRRANESQA